MGYRVVVKIAGVGAQYQEDGTITTSKTGHVWLTLINDQTGEDFNFGFHPAKEGSPISKNGVVKTDDYRYLDITYQRSLVISADQFNNLYAICQNALENHTFGMYLGGYNACPEFAFDAILQAGIGNKMLIPTTNGEGIVLDVTQKLVANIPTNNIGLLRYIADHNDKYIAPALSGSGLDGRDTSNRTNVISNILQNSNTKSSAHSDLTTSIVTQQDSNTTSSTTTLPNFSEATFAQKWQYNFQTPAPLYFDTNLTPKYMINASILNPNTVKMQNFFGSNVDWTMFEKHYAFERTSDDIQLENIEVWIGDKMYKGAGYQPSNGRD